MKEFDLNIEKVLEDWEIFHAVREIIANALDEQILTKTKDIEIKKDKNRFIIRDYGRGLRYKHLTQNENEEKITNYQLVIGKFGVGLKDALATFDRHQIKIILRSRYGDITIVKSTKHGFDDIVTLHAIISEPSDPNLVGTEVILEGCIQDDIEKAKSLFLKFSGEKILDKTQYGEIFQRIDISPAKIYMNGIRVAEEENFLFSYNITSLTSVMKKALNRERTHVGRTAYADRVKQILLECRKKEVEKLLVDDLKKFETGRLHDELDWIDVSVHACKLLNATDKVIFPTSSELLFAGDMIDKARRDGSKVVTIPDSVKERIRGLKDFEGNLIRDLEEYRHEWNTSFEFKFVKPEDLSANEREVFEKTLQIFKLIGGQPKQIEKILISETMRREQSGMEAAGLWESAKKLIIIKRDQLKDLKLYAGTLLHETSHALSGAGDVSREFEEQLTQLLGLVSSKTTK